MGRSQIFVVKFTRFGGEVERLERTEWKKIKPKLNYNRQEVPAKPF
jgi:hypothetical protein